MGKINPVIKKNIYISLFETFMPNLMKFIYVLVLFLTTGTLSSQIKDGYFFPKETVLDPGIPTPLEVLGHEVGDWHVTHDKLVFYMQALAAASPRISIKEMGRTHESRIQLLLTITSPDNQEKLKEIKSDHKKLVLAPNEKHDYKNMPVVIWQGFSIHGNESSGSNAAILAVYYYAAAKNVEVKEWLENAVILLDPCYNPDGLNRFASWVNSNKSKNLIADGNSRELNEFWPRGRTNHYLFDLNRDWLPLQQPESQNRIYEFHEWKPNILTDHHEMGSNSTFFFQPGIPSRNNPNTPKENFILTEKISKYHAKALDEIGSLYYAKESFDDFYYGKGSTFPDINGGIGILFEQASSRGHLHETIHGDMSFPFTIKNQLMTAFSTIRAGVALREELLDYQAQFYKGAKQESMKIGKKGVVFGSGSDQHRAQELVNVLAQHQIDVFPILKDQKINGTLFYKGTGFYVPYDQEQFKLIKIIFEKTTDFNDSLFYDVSTWTLPLAFGLDYQEIDKQPISIGEKYQMIKTKPLLEIAPSNYAYAVKWEDYYAPALIYNLLKNKIRLKVATKAFVLNGYKFDAGTILIPRQIQESPESLQTILTQATARYSAQIIPLNTGESEGVYLGSGSFKAIDLPKVALVVEGGASSYEAGEVWHLLDNRFDIHVTLLPNRIFEKVDLNRYNVLVMVDGKYSIDDANKEKLELWIKKGGTLIAVKNANKFLIEKEIIKLEIEEYPKNKQVVLKYDDIQKFNGAQRIGGSVFETSLDLTHPIGFGYENEDLPIFINDTNFFKDPENKLSVPLRLKTNPLISGYVSDENAERISDRPAIIVSKIGKGRVISFDFNPNFRAFWYGTNKLFLNAVFFGKIIQPEASNK